LARWPVFRTMGGGATLIMVGWYGGGIRTGIVGVADRRAEWALEAGAGKSADGACSQSSSLCWRAMAIASARLEAPSLDRMLLT
jgi:hypothetical protein